MPAMAVSLATSVLFLMTLTCLVGVARAVGISACAKKSACACLAQDGLIDLALLSKDEFPGLVAKRQDEIFYYNPCNNFDMGPLKNVGLVLNRSNHYTAIGDNRMVSFKIQNEEVVLSTRKGIRTSDIILRCDFNAKSARFDLSGPQPLDGHVFVLTSPYCCPGETSPVPPGTNSPSIATKGSGGLSLGSVMLIVFFSTIVAYFVMGTICQSAVGKAEGKERIPNYSFWSLLPALIRDGTIFIFTCGRRPEYKDIDFQQKY